MTNGDFDLSEYTDLNRGQKATQERQVRHGGKRGGWFRGDQQATVPKVTEVTGACSVSGLPGWASTGQQPLSPEEALDRKNK